MRYTRLWPSTRALRNQHGTRYPTTLWRPAFPSASFLSTASLAGTNPETPRINDIGIASRLRPFTTSAVASDILDETIRRSEYQGPVVSPSKSERKGKKTTNWLKALEPFLPLELRKRLPDESQLPTNDGSSLADLLWTISTARRSDYVDVLAHIAVEEERWEATLWIVQALLNGFPRVPKPATSQDSFSNLVWPSSSTLEDVTAAPTLLEYKSTDIRHHHIFLGPKEAVHAQQEGLQGHLAVGQIFQTVGSLLITAAQLEGQAQVETMAHTLRILALLHHHDWIPAEVYRLSSNQDSSALLQPPLLHQLSSVMLSCLSNVGYPANVDHEDIPGAGSFTSPTSAQPGPEIWMEFVLWCCVHGLWLIEGAAIIENMRRVIQARWRDKKRWEVLHWREMVDIFEGTNHGRRQDRLHGDRQAIPQTITAEVVEALVDGLTIALNSNKAGLSGYNVSAVVGWLSELKYTLERDRVSLEHSTWDAKLARLAEIPDNQLEHNPRVIERALELAETYGRGSNIHSQQIMRANELVPSYVFDASAAMLGMYHRTLQSYIKSRDVNGALRLMSKLQSMTDKNKTKSLQEFFEELKAMSLAPLVKYDYDGELSFNYNDVFPGVQYPGFYPDVPVPILADLLDMINEAGALEIGRWMIYSTDIDGPLIDEELYNDQAMAAALIRFAATTRDSALLAKLTRAQTSVVSAKTLIALCDSHIQDSNWKGAADILSLIRDHAIYAWTSEDFGRLLRPLVIAAAKENADGEKSDAPKPASSLMQRLLRGDLGQVWGTKFSELDTIAGVLSSIDPVLKPLCTGLLVAGKDYLVDMQTSTFDLILQGAVTAFGSERGRDLWQMWCIPSESRKNLQVIKDTESFWAESESSSISERFFGHEDPDALVARLKAKHRNLATFKGYVIPQIETIRIIIQQALVEQRKLHAGEQTKDSPDEQTKSLHHGILSWAANILRDDFSRSENDINYELEGYLSTFPQDLTDETPYRLQTIRTWRVFTGPRKQWALKQDERLRTFARKREERQMIFEDVQSVERLLIHCLAADYGLVSESLGKGSETIVSISKPVHVAPLPERTIEEVVQRLDIPSKPA